MLSLPLTDSGRYAAQGSGVTGGRTFGLLARFRVLRQNGQLRIDGYAQAGSTEAPGAKHDFRLRLRFGTSILAGGRFEYADERFKMLSGTLAWAEDCYLMAGHCYAPNASVSLHLLPGTVHNHYELRGLFSPAAGAPVSFALSIAPDRTARGLPAGDLAQLTT